MADWESTRRAYHAMAVAYHERFPDRRAEQPFDRAMLSAFAAYVRGQGDSGVLGAGCGTGRLITPLRELGLEVAGVDLRRMPFPDERFAGVVARYSLIYCSPVDLGEALAEIARILRPGGYLLTGFQAGAGRRTLLSQFSQGHELELHLRTCDEMTAAFTAAGLAVVGQARRAPEPDTPYGADDQAAFVIGRRPSPPR